jgi:hypothetical protein
MRTPLPRFAAAASIAASLTAGGFAQTEPAKVIDPATKQAHDRLPEDQPRVAASPRATSSPAGAAQPSEADVMKEILEFATPGENHKLLAGLVGSWTYTFKMWMDPSEPPTESTGVAVTKPTLDGRYFTTENTGKIPMPGPDGKIKEMDFKGIATDGYDNVKKKFVSAWIDNMGTGIMLSEGTYDPATKTFTYLSGAEPAPGMKTKVRETVKIVDQDHHVFAFYEDNGGQEAKTMEISCTRKK